MTFKASKAGEDITMRITWKRGDYGKERYWEDFSQQGLV